MNIIASIYRDANGDVWEISRQTLPKKKGEYIFWVAECPKKNISLRGNLKKEVLNRIQETIKKHKL